MLLGVRNKWLEDNSFIPFTHGISNQSWKRGFGYKYSRLSRSIMEPYFGQDLLKLSLTKLKALKSSPKSTMGMSMSNTELHAEEAINNHHSLLGDVYMEKGQVLLVWLALARGASPRVYMGRAALLIVLATFIFPWNPEPIFAYKFSLYDLHISKQNL